MEYVELKDKIAIITGGDSGIGKEIALLLAKHGVHIAIVNYNDQEDNIDAKDTEEQILQMGRKCVTFSGDINEDVFCKEICETVINLWGSIDILINNAGIQFPETSIENLKEENVRRTFNSNIIGMILLTKAVYPHLKMGDSIVNTTSAVANQGHEELLDYSATKGAIVSFTRSMALHAKYKGIRVNAVSPGPVSTPLTEKTFGEEKEDPHQPPLERNASTEEIASCFLFLVSNSSAQITGQVLHPNGGMIVNG